ncbi:MAG TPA: hypothetical protein VK783_00705 [Bacteroidia bacterium]|nr:hypothetical protein [Bacteroidia bacterium]
MKDDKIKHTAVNGFMETILGIGRLKDSMSKHQPSKTNMLSIATNAANTLLKRFNWRADSAGFLRVAIFIYST